MRRPQNTSSSAKTKAPNNTDPSIVSAGKPEQHPQNNHFREFLLLITLIVLGIHHHQILSNLSAPIAVVPLAIACALIIFLMITYWSHKKPLSAKVQDGFSFIDGLLTAIVISEINYLIWASLILITLLYVKSLYANTTRPWLLTNTGLVVGVLLGIFVLQNTNYTLAIPTTTADILSIAVALGGLLFCSWHTYSVKKQSRVLESQSEELQAQIKEYKLQAYELSRFLPSSAKIQLEKKKKPKIERKPITIFFSDIVGFSSLSEELEAETLSNVLSSYLAEMSDIVAQYNGTIDKFIGDAIMVTFGDDSTTTQGVKKDAIACVSMAISMGKRMRELQATWAEMGIKKPLQIRMGINSGYCTVGAFGTSQHLDYTALGVHVNLASRLESAGKPEDILISHETWNLVKDTILCKDRGQIKAKGFTHPVQVYQVINHRKELGSNQSYYSKTIDGFSMHLDMQKVKNYDREKVISTLELAAKKLKEKLPRG